MRRVEGKPFRDYFRSGLEHRQIQAGPFLYRKRHLFNGVSLLTIVLVILLCASPFSRASRVVGAALAAFTAGLFSSAQASAKGVFIKRRLKQSDAIEGDEVEVVLEITNASDFRIPPGWVVEDDFGPSLESKIQLVEERDLPPRSKIFLTYKRKCDAGMGSHVIGPLRMRVSDLLGFFEYHVDDSATEWMDIHPRVKELPNLPVTGSPNSSSYGAYEVAARGMSVNFSGVRPYVHGDSIRHIAWKLSARGREQLLVKEFEKVVNSDVTVVVNLDSWLHVGHKSFSTWEAAKDVSLSIVSQQLEIGNSVQVLTNELQVASSRGEDHFHLISRRLMNAVPTSEGRGGRRLVDLVSRFSELVPAGGTLIYISVFDQNEVSMVTSALATLVERNVQVFCVYLNPAPIFAKMDLDPMLAMVLGGKGVGEIDSHLRRLELIGAKVFVVDDIANFVPSFLEGAG